MAASLTPDSHAGPGHHGIWYGTPASGMDLAIYDSLQGPEPVRQSDLSPDNPIEPSCLPLEDVTEPSIICQDSLAHVRKSLLIFRNELHLKIPEAF